MADILANRVYFLLTAAAKHNAMKAMRVSKNSKVVALTAKQYTETHYKVL